MTIVWWNGRFLPEARARTSVLDRGVLFADGAFETMRLYDGAPFALDAHLDRLTNTTRMLDLEIDLDPARWRPRIEELARRNDAMEAVVRLTVIRGGGGELGSVRRGTRPSALLHQRTLPPGLERRRRTGARATIVDLEPGGLAGHKTLSLTATAHAKRIAATRGADEALLRARDGSLPEGATSNLFVLDERGCLRTPPLDGRTLPGVTRAIVLDLAAEAGVGTLEAPVRPEDLRGAREAFLTSSVLELLPLRSVDGEPIGSGRRPVTRELARRYAALRQRR